MPYEHRPVSMYVYASDKIGMKYRSDYIKPDNTLWNKVLPGVFFGAKQIFTTAGKKT